MEKLEWVKADAATIKAFAEAGQKTEVETAREAAEAEATYRMNLECAESALSFKRLTDEDRKDIEIAVIHLKIGWALHEQTSDPIQLRLAANYLMFAAHVIGSRGTVCDSEKIFWDIEAHGPQGAKTGAAAREQAEKWKGAARRRIAEKDAARAKLSAPQLARILKKEEGKPGATKYPEIETLTKFIRKERKSGVKSKGKNLRLVHG